MHLSVSELAGELFRCTSKPHELSNHQLPQCLLQLAVIAAGMLRDIPFPSPLHAFMLTNSEAMACLRVVILRQYATP